MGWKKNNRYPENLQWKWLYARLNKSRRPIPQNCTYTLSRILYFHNTHGSSVYRNKSDGGVKSRVKSLHFFSSLDFAERTEQYFGNTMILLCYFYFFIYLFYSVCEQLFNRKSCSYQKLYDNCFIEISILAVHSETVYIYFPHIFPHYNGENVWETDKYSYNGFWFFFFIILLKTNIFFEFIGIISFF